MGDMFGFVCEITSYFVMRASAEGMGKKFFSEQKRKNLVTRVSIFYAPCRFGINGVVIT